MKVISISLLAVLSVGSLLSWAQDTAPQPKTFAITEERNAAVGFALAAGLVTGNITKNCALLKDDALQDSEKVLSNWKQKNGAYIEASLGYLQYASTLIGSRKGKEEGRSFYQNAQSEIQKQAGFTLRDSFSSQPPNRQRCEKLLGLIASGEMDLKAMDSRGKDNFMRTLDEIVALHHWVLERNKKP